MLEMYFISAYVHGIQVRLINYNIFERESPEATSIY